MRADLQMDVLASDVLLQAGGARAVLRPVAGGRICSLFTRQQSIDQAAYLTFGSWKYEITRSGVF